MAMQIPTSSRGRPQRLALRSDGLADLPGIVAQARSVG